MRIQLVSLKDSFFKSMSILASGSIISQIITVITAPILTRLFSVEEIGIYTYIVSIATLFMSTINLRYDMAIVSEEDEKNIYPLIKLCLLIGGILSVIISIGYIFYLNFVKVEYKQYTFSAVFIFMLLNSYMIINILNAYNTRKEEYKIMTTMYLVRTSCQNFGGIFFGLFNVGIIGLLLPYTIGQVLGIKKQMSSLKNHIHDIIGANRRQVVSLAKKHYKQVVYSTPALFANSFSYNSITLFIEMLFGMSVVGLYSISVRILGIPLSVISGNVSKVFFQQASLEFRKTGAYRKTYIKSFMFLLVISIPMTIGMIMLGPWVCKTFFGDEWIIAGEYIRILAPMFGVRFIATALSPGLIISRKQNYELWIQILLLLTSVVSFLIALLMSISIEHFLQIVCISKAIVYLLLIVVVFYCSTIGKKE